MNHYYIANEKADFNFYPNYSFETGDIDGDGKKEFIALDQTGNTLKAIDLDGNLVFEQKLDNNGNWGTVLIGAADINGDGRDEVIVPCGERVVAFDGKKNIVKEHKLDTNQKDDYGICVPLLGVAKILSPDAPSVIAAAAGGIVTALDNDFNEIWRTGGFRGQYGHEIHFADIDGDGLDEIAFCTVDHINLGFDKNANTGELVLLDHDGTVLFRRRVDDYIDDTHFDDIAMADFLGDGTSQILLEKGVLIDLSGNIIWDVSKQMDHGQWIAYAPSSDGKGKIIFISELWGYVKKSMLLTGQGKKIADIGKFPWPQYTEKAVFAPTRAHAVQWDAQSEQEIFLAQQAIMGGHGSTETYKFGLKGLFMDLRGNLVGELPFDDAQIAGYYYNGEVHSKTADVDGDGLQEIIYPKQDGKIMVIKRTKQ